MSDEPLLYNSRIVNTFLGLLSRKYRDLDLDELLQYAGMKPSEVRDEGHWFTQRQIDRFHERIHQLTGRDVSREAGRFAGTGESLGLMNKYVMGMIGPAHTFHAIGKATAKLTRSTIYTSRKIAETKVEITVTPIPGIEERPFQCANRIGFFEAVLALFNYDMPDIEHTECMFQGGACCRYVVSWKKTWWARLRTVRNVVLLPLFLLATLLLLWTHWSWLYAALAALALTFMACFCVALRLENRELLSALQNQKESSDQLVEQVGENYNNVRLVNEVGQAISTQSDIDEVLENVVKALENRLRFDRCLIFLADAQKTTLHFRTGFGYPEERLPVLKEVAFDLTKPESTGVFVRCFHEQRPIFVDKFSEVSHQHSARSISFADQFKADSFICCAIVCEGEPLGVLAVDNKRTNKKLTQSDLNLLAGVAPVIGISIRNAVYIDRERKLAEQIRHSQKMEAVGQLAGGVAHDFNNLLTAIIGFGHLTEMRMREDDPAHKYLKQLFAAAERATNLTQGLLAFSRKKVNDPKPIDLNGTVGEIRKLLIRLITAEIELDLTLCEERLYLMADAGQIDQVIMNLVTNARDAMNGKGVLTIRTAAAEMSEDFVRSRGFGAVGSYALLSVGDTGTGMDEETKARIFEPFFTTKAVGKGTGLGMAIVYGVVQQHGGYLDIVSAPGQGTTFNIYLPLLQKEVTTTRRQETAEGSYQGTETVLVAEDAPEVRRFTAELLAQNGYHVIEAADGQDALEKFSENSSDVDLVIMDVVMPKMSGKDVFSEIAKINPRMKVLYTSGYTADDVKKKGVTFAKENFLAKPSTPQTLLKKIREMLAA